MMSLFHLIGASLGAYLCGAFPTSYYIAAYKGITDITTVGSGNSGATNVGRMLGAYYFMLVLFIDAAKAFLFLFLMQRYHLSSLFIAWCALLLMIGNAYSIFLGGKGGKGVATGIGIVLVLHPFLFLSLCVVWLLVFMKVYIVGIASVATYCMLPALAWYFSISPELFIVFSIIALLGIYRHKKNISDWILLVRE